MRVERNHGASRFVQHIEVTADSRQVTVHNDVDRRERVTVLKVEDKGRLALNAVRNGNYVH